MKNIACLATSAFFLETELLVYNVFYSPREPSPPSRAKVHTFSLFTPHLRFRNHLLLSLPCLFCLFCLFYHFSTFNCEAPAASLSPLAALLLPSSSRLLRPSLNDIIHHYYPPVLQDLQKATCPVRGGGTTGLNEPPDKKNVPDDLSSSCFSSI